MNIRDILQQIYKVYAYLIYVPVLVASTTIMGSLAAVLAMLVGPSTGSLMGVIWARINAFFTPMFVSIRGQENIEPGQSYVVTANHQSFYDIFALYGWLPLDFRWVMKMELRKVPFLGYSTWKIGHIFIDRSNHDAAIKSINEAKQRITGGVSVLFFPEGRRQDKVPLAKFKKGAFRFAVDTGLPVLPVTIIGTKKILPPGSLSLFPGKIEIVIHKPVPGDNYTDENLEGYAEEVKSIIASGLPPSY